jgi:hypothetical protein
MAEEIETSVQAARTRARRMAALTGRTVVTILALLVAVFTVLAARSFAGRSTSKQGTSATATLRPASFVLSARQEIARARAAARAAAATPVSDPTPPAPPTQSAAPAGTSSAGSTTIS